MGQGANAQGEGVALSEPQVRTEGVAPRVGKPSRRRWDSLDLKGEWT